MTTATSSRNRGEIPLIPYDASLYQLVNRVNMCSQALSDLQSLVLFLEENPGKDIKDWARYEAVKSKFKEVV